MQSEDIAFFSLPDFVVAPALALLITATYLVGLIVWRSLKDHLQFAYMPLIAIWAFSCFMAQLAALPSSEAFWTLILPVILFTVPVAAGRLALSLFVIFCIAAWVGQILYMPEMTLPGPGWDLSLALKKAIGAEMTEPLRLSLPLFVWLALSSVTAFAIFNVQTPKIKEGISGKFHWQTGLMITSFSFILTLMAFSVQTAQAESEMMIIDWPQLLWQSGLTAFLTFACWRILCMEIVRMKILQLSSMQMASFQKHPLACLIIGPNGNIRWANPAATGLLGFSYDQLLRRNVRDIEYNAGHADASYKKLSQAGDWPRQLEGRYLRKDSVEQVCTIYADQIETSTGLAVMLCLTPTESKRTVLEVVNEVAETQSEPVTQDKESPQIAVIQPIAEEKRDPVTGLRMKEAMLQLAKPLAEKVSQEHLDNVTLVIAELEEFEDWVAKRGAAMGKALLQGYARTLSQTLRPEDKIFYIGEYRFGVVMPGRGEGATALLRKRFKEVVSLTHHAGFEGVTTQIGFAAVTEADFDVDKTFELALQRSQDRRWSRI